MPEAPAPVIAISSWSLHRALGIFHPNAPDNDVAGGAIEKWGPPSLSLLDLPAAVADLGIDRLQICHFHLESRDPAYLGEVRAAADDAGVTLSTLLIDDGDLSHPAHAARDRDWIGRWIDAAAELGAESARVVAGKQKPSPETLAASVEGLRALARRGAAQGVRVMTENWLALLETPREVHYVLDHADGELGFLADFGNWRTQGPKRYDDLASIFARAEDTHAKASFPSGLAMDRDDFGLCLEAAKRAGYEGPYTLIYEDSAGDEREAVKLERDFVRGYFNGGNA